MGTESERTIEMAVGGQRMRLTGQDAVYLEGMDGGDFTADPLLGLARTLRDGGIYLDVGANIGVTSIAVALQRPDLRIAAFEPVSGNADFLERNVAENGVHNVTVVRAAIGATPGAVTINDNGPWSMVGLPGPTVTAVTLDGWCDEHRRGESVDLIKIDAEGYEPAVLIGASFVLSTWRPRVMMEMNSYCLICQDFNPIHFAQYLIDQFDIQTQGNLDTVNATRMIQDNLLNHGSVNNIIVRPKAKFVPPNHGAFAFTGGDRRLVEELRAIRSSTSWRITAPLRRVGSLLRGGH